MFQEKFSHIYVEKEIKDEPKVKEILAHFKKAEIIEINHYKDIFCRHGMDVNMQKKYPKLILAYNREKSIYKGSPVCNSFGNQNFYYTSNMKNCIYNCEYCYLLGMYQCGYIVVFINIEDTFKEVEKILKKHDAYICISYDTDLLAFEKITGFVEKWIRFCNEHKNLKIEIRTKSGNKDSIKKLANIISGQDFQEIKSNNIIFAFTLSPDEIRDMYEKNTPSLEARIAAAREAVEAGFASRLCFDPMIYVKDYKKIYREMFEKISEKIPLEKILDYSIGSFRISKEYLKNMRKNNPESTIANFPYEIKKGFYFYPFNIEKEMEEYMKEVILEKEKDPRKIFGMEIL